MHLTVEVAKEMHVQCTFRILFDNEIVKSVQKYMVIRYHINITNVRYRTRFVGEKYVVFVYFFIFMSINKITHNVWSAVHPNVLKQIVDTFYSCLKSSVLTICFGKTVANKFNLAGVCCRSVVYTGFLHQ
jgi:hypothetical protein